jgi:hypothetical protein
MRLGLGIPASRRRRAQAPVGTVAPVASGTVVVGGTLSCTTGTWSGTAPLSYAYQWRRDGVDIGGATASAYTPVHADIGPALTCAVTASNAAGSATAASNVLAYSPTTDAAVLECWYPTSLTAGAVAAWLGQKLAASLAQGTGGAQPAYSATAIGGAAPGVTFGGDDLLSTAALGPALAGLGGFRVVLAVVDATAATKVVFGYGTNGNSDPGFEFLVNDAGALEVNVFLGATNALTYGAGTLATVTVVSLLVDFTSANGCAGIRANGAAVSVSRLGAITPGVAPNKSIFLGARSGIQLAWPGTVGVLGILTGTAADDALDNFERFVANRAGVSW